MYKIDDIHYMVSLYCPGECLNCSIWKYDKKEITKNEIDLEIFEKILQSKVLTNTNYFNLTAGESQLSPKYVDVVKLITKYKKDAFIHTNISGWYPKKHFEVTKECLKYIDKSKFRVDISLDGSRENYKKVRLVKDGFDKAIESAKLLKELDISIRFVMVLYKDTYKDIDFIVNLAKEIGIGYYIGYPRESINYIKSSSKSNYFNSSEIEWIDEKLNSINWFSNKQKLREWLWAKSVYENKIPYFNCLMGKETFVIDPYGNIYPCNELLEELLMGNIKDFDGDLDKLLNSQKALDVIKYIEDKKCQPCGMLCAHKMEFPMDIK